MIKNNQHSIHRINLDITANNEVQAIEIKDNISYFLKEQLFPKIEDLFDELEYADEIKRFETIDLSLHLKTLNDMTFVKQQLISQLREKIEFAASTITDRQNSKSNYQQGKNQNNELIFLNFMNSGQLPWYANESNFQEYMETGNLFLSLRDDRFVQLLKQLFRSNQKSIRRFIKQFDNNTIEELIFNLSEENKINRPKFNLRISRHEQWIKDSVYFLLISNFSHRSESVSKKLYQDLIIEIQERTTSQRSADKTISRIHELLNLLHLGRSDTKIQIKHPEIRIQKQGNKTDSRFETQQLNIDLRNIPDSKEQSDKPINWEEIQGNPMENSISHFAETRSDDVSGIEKQLNQISNKLNLNAVYIQNAGLILAHPFLWDLFSRTNCTDGYNNLLSEMKDKAIHLLHYLATGNEQEMEYNLTFEKFLCGIPLDSPVDRKIILSDQEKIECNDLLRSLIKFWPELKSTSPDGLRQMFLQRNGKIDLHKPPFKLYVERKAQDVLLDKLQWNISIVKLPWITELLFTQW